GHRGPLAGGGDARARVVRDADAARPGVACPGVVAGAHARDRRAVAPVAVDVARVARPAARPPGDGAAARAVRHAAPPRVPRVVPGPPGPPPAPRPPPRIGAPAPAGGDGLLAPGPAEAEGDGPSRPRRI